MGRKTCHACSDSKYLASHCVNGEWASHTNDFGSSRVPCTSCKSFLETLCGLRASLFNTLSLSQLLALIVFLLPPFPLSQASALSHSFTLSQHPPIFPFQVSGLRLILIRPFSFQSDLMPAAHRTWEKCKEQNLKLIADIKHRQVWNNFGQFNTWEVCLYWKLFFTTEKGW